MPNWKLSGAKGDALPEDVKEGKTFVSENGDFEQVGTLPVTSSETITPASTTKSITDGHHDNLTIKGDSDLQSENIRDGYNIFGVNGSYDPGLNLLGYDSDSETFSDTIIEPVANPINTYDTALVAAFGWSVRGTDNSSIMWSETSIDLSIGGVQVASGYSGAGALSGSRMVSGNPDVMASVDMRGQSDRTFVCCSGFGFNISG